jgi:hypothetical protein
MGKKSEIRNLLFFVNFEKDRKSQRKFLGHQRYDEIKLCMNKFKRKYIKSRKN